jgi:integrase
MGDEKMARGYCRQRGKDKWQLEVDLGYYIDPKTGKKKRHKKYKTITATGQRQAELELARFVAEVTGGSYFEPERVNFVEFVQNEWIPKCAKKRLAPTTYDRYLECVNNRILPAFQYLRMDQIKPKHIIDFLHNLEEEGMRLDGKKGKLSRSRIYYHYRVLNNIFNFAVELQILQENPVKKIEKPKVEYREMEIYTDDEVAHLLECLKKESQAPHWQIIIKLAIFTGMRRSELCGLEFKHFDYEKGIVRVRQALTYTKTNGYEIHEIRKGNRTARQREIHIPLSLAAEVEKLYAQREQERFAIGKEKLWEKGKYNFILAHEDGRPYHPRTVQRWWERFLKRHNLKYINIHALRHTSATLLLNQGVHAKIISERLGHSNTTVTMGIYGHAIQEADKLATEKLESVINRSTKSI